MVDYQQVLDMLKNASELHDALKEYLRDAENPSDFAISEFIAEMIADAAGMTAVTDDDLPKKKEG